MQKLKTIGFDKKIPYSWIDAVAYWASQSLTEQEIADRIDSLLNKKLSDTGKRSSKSKVKSILLRIWMRPEEHIKALHASALSLYPHCSDNEKLLLHWGMSGATYPFFFHIAEHVGRLIALTREVKTSQILRRVQESHGERSTLKYACRRIIRTFVEWGVLHDTKKKGTVRFKEKINIARNPHLFAWFLEAYLYGTQKETGVFASMMQNPLLFPFSLDAIINDMQKNPRLTVYRQNVDDDMVMLKRE